MHYVLKNVEEVLDLDNQPWVSYELTGTNGGDISGWMRGNIATVKPILQKQIRGANKRRRPAQAWTAWTWSLHPGE